MRTCREPLCQTPEETPEMSPFGSSATAQCSAGVQLGGLAAAPPQTQERPAKALQALEAVEQLACDQHDHVSFAKAWMSLCKRVAMPSD